MLILLNTIMKIVLLLDVLVHIVVLFTMKVENVGCLIMQLWQFQKKIVMLDFATTC